MRRLLALGLCLLALLVPPPAAAQTPVPSVAILQNTVAANGNGNVMPVLNFQVVLVQITTPSGSPTFTVNFEGAANEQGPAATPSTFSAIECTSLAASATLATTATSPGSWRCTVTGLTHFQARVSGYSGTGTVRVIGTSLGGSISSSSRSGRPGGSDTYVQFNDGGVLGGDAGFVYSKSTDTATLGGLNVAGSGAGRVSLKDASGNYVLLITGSGENLCSDAGANDTYTCSITDGTNSLQAYVTGLRYRFKANTANTGAATINFNSLGAKTIKKVAGGITTDLADNDIRSGQWVDLVYDGTNMQMQSTLGNAGSGVGGSGTNGKVARWTAGTTLGDSTISDDGTTPVLPVTAQLTAGTGTGRPKPTGVLCASAADATTAGTSEEVLYTCTIPANSLSANAKGLRVSVELLAANTGNSKTAQIRWGGIGGTICVLITDAAANSSMELNCLILRSGASTQRLKGQKFGDGVSYGTFYNTSSQTDTGAIDLVVTGTTATIAGDITMKMIVVEFIN